ncbi:hypothetical protein HKX48_001030, partial [Thoreauomyces humboldtii]
MYARILAALTVFGEYEFANHRYVIYVSQEGQLEEYECDCQERYVLSPTCDLAQIKQALAERIHLYLGSDQVAMEAPG